METLRRWFVAVWTFLFTAKENKASGIKWVCVVVAGLINGCSSIASKDLWPFYLVLYFAGIHAFVWDICTQIHEKKIKIGLQHVNCEDRSWWHPLWFFSAMAVILFSFLFRFGNSNEIYYDRAEKRVVEKSLVNVLPFWRYKIFIQSDVPQTIDPHLTLHKEFGQVRVTVKCNMKVLVSKEKAFEYFRLMMSGRFGTTTVPDVITSIGTDLHKVDGGLLLESMAEFTDPGFEARYEQSIKSFFQGQGVPIEGQLEIQQITISPRYYNEEGSKSPGSLP